MKLGPAIAALAAISSLALGGCSSTPAGNTNAAVASNSKSVTSITIGSLADAKSFDPVDAHLGHPMPIFQAAYDSLVRKEPDGKLVPMLATAWEYNQDNTILKMSVRDGVTFSDGTAFDAVTVKSNLDNFKAAKGQDVYQVASLKEVNVVDPRTVTISLTAPDPAFVGYLAQAAGLMASPKSLGTPELKTQPQGSGPYVLDKASSVKGSQYVFTKRQGYWEPDLQKFNKVTIKILPDATARTNALVSGQIDATVLDPKNGKQAESAGLTLNKNQAGWLGMLLYDRDGKISPELGNVKVRQAISYAFDRQAILEGQLMGEGTLTTQIFGPDSGAYDPDLDSRYSYDPAKAKQLLAEAGYPNGFTLKYPTTPGSDALNTVFAQQLSEVGIKLDLAPIPQANYVADMAAGKYAAAYYQLAQGDPWSTINLEASPTALYNPFKTTTPELASLIATVQTGGSKSPELAKAVNRYLVENAWFVPMFRPNQMFYSSKNVVVQPQAQEAVPAIYNYSPAD